uniref:Uncharacterized protein n=1 Tax=Mus musculus TaxID=10090 RepID=Q9D018_MOUSE|nr:unnamed protein product [Mus musculus]
MHACCTLHQPFSLTWMLIDVGRGEILHQVSKQVLERILSYGWMISLGLRSWNCTIGPKMANSMFAQATAASRLREISVEGPLITFGLFGDTNSSAIYGDLWCMHY